MRIVCWQTILMNYHADFSKKSGKIGNYRLLQNVGGALRVMIAYTHKYVHNITGAFTAGI